MTYCVLQAVSAAFLLLFKAVTGYVISDSVGYGRVFDGIGAVSGGSVSRLV